MLGSKGFNHRQLLMKKRLLNPRSCIWPTWLIYWLNGYVIYVNFCFKLQMAETSFSFVMKGAGYSKKAVQSGWVRTLLAFFVVPFVNYEHFRRTDGHKFTIGKTKGRFLVIAKAHVIHFLNNPLAPESDHHLISPYLITAKSYIKVSRIKEIITK